MIVNLKTEKLKVGMFIDLSDSWMSNPFWKSSFEIKSEKEIDKIIKAGIKGVNVDTNKSRIPIDIPQEKKAETVGEKTDAVHSRETKKETTNGESAISTTVRKPDVSAEKIEDKIGAEKVKKTKKDAPAKQDNADIGNIKVVDREMPEGHDSKDSSPPAEWKPEEFMPLEFVHAVRDKNLPPNDRVKAVQNYSIELMKNLLENPTAEVIGASKIGISEIVGIIINEDTTSQGLIKVVSHDFYTYTHSVNVGLKSILLAKRLYKSSDRKEMDELGAGFFLHDLGKVNIDPDILNKPGRLTEEEMGIIRTHPYQSYKILMEAKQLTTEAWIIAMQHHERDDGKGYPRKLKGEEIHPHARICCIADVYDALTAKRSYKEPKPPIEALRIMYEEMATHFNKELLQNFIALFKEKK